MKEVFLFGGDVRYLHLFYVLSEQGVPVRSMGLMQEEPSQTLAECLAWAKVVLLPVPSVVGDPPFIPLGKEGAGIPLAGFAQNLQMGTTVVTSQPEGVNAAPLKDACQKVGCQMVNLLESESFKAGNAVPTAEGAIYHALENGRRSLAGSASMVVGFGQVGRELAKDLVALGAKVTVSARRPEQMEEIERLGYQPVHSYSLDQALPVQNFIFNTVPHCLLGEKELRLLRPDALYIELASIPYGFDKEAAQRLGIREGIYPGIPGKMFPQTAAQIIYKELKSYL